MCAAAIETAGRAARTRPAPSPVDDAARQLDDILRAGRVRTVFQPIVELDTRRVRGYEALSRGPSGSELEAPDRLFATAARAGRVAELDRVCRSRALESATQIGWPSGCMLSVNAEPSTFADQTVPDVEAFGRLHFPVMMEFTERDVADDPAGLIAYARRLRACGWIIALDDVGANPDSLALLPLLQPGVIKLDRSLLSGRLDGRAMTVINAVNAESERTGAIVVAEGVETAEHEARAVAFGASHGQGWFYGRPEPELAASSHDPWDADHLRTFPPAVESDGAEPFGRIRSEQRVHRTTKPLLVEISRQLEATALSMGHPPIILATLQSVEQFTPSTKRMYERLAEHCPFVALFGGGISDTPLRGVRGASLAPDDPMLAEWDVVLLSPHRSVALLARDVGDAGPDSERRFDYVLTYDRATVIEAATCMMRRIEPRRSLAHPTRQLDVVPCAGTPTSRTILSTRSSGNRAV